MDFVMDKFFCSTSGASSFLPHLRNELLFGRFQVILPEGEEVAAVCLDTEVLKETCVCRVTFGS